MGAEVSRLTAPLEVHQGIVLTLPENAIESVRRHLAAVIRWAGFLLGPRSRGENGWVIQNGLVVVLPFLAH